MFNSTRMGIELAELYCSPLLRFTTARQAGSTGSQASGTIPLSALRNSLSAKLSRTKFQTSLHRKAGAEAQGELFPYTGMV